MVGVLPRPPGEPWPDYLHVEAECLVVRHDKQHVPISPRSDFTEDVAAARAIDRQQAAEESAAERHHVAHAQQPDAHAYFRNAGPMLPPGSNSTGNITMSRSDLPRAMASIQRTMRRAGRLLS